MSPPPYPPFSSFPHSPPSGTLRVWSTEPRYESMVGYKDLVIQDQRVMARAVAWSPDGTKLVVGIGGRVGRKRVGTKDKHDGEIYIFRLKSDGGSDKHDSFLPHPSKKFGYQVELFQDEPPTNLANGVSLRPHPKAWISDIKFSTQALAVAAHDNQIYLYNAQTFTLRCRCKGHSGSVLHIDFSQDGRVLQSTSNDYELLFWDVNTGKQLTRPSSLRDQKWQTFTCPLGWPVQGIWPKSADGTDINAVDLYQSPNDVRLIKDNRCNQYVGLLATVDDFGKVKLFNSPAEKPGAASIEYRGHSAHVTSCRFTPSAGSGSSGGGGGGSGGSGGRGRGDTYLLTTGGEDRAIMQWKLDVDEVNHNETAVTQEEKDAMNPGWTPRSTQDTDQHQAVVYDPLDAAFEFGSAGGGDEFMAVKPWVGAIKAPTNPPKPVPNIVPETDLELQWVNGFNSFSSRNAVHYDAEGALHYPAATLNVRTKLKDGEKEKPLSMDQTQEEKEKEMSDGDKPARYNPSQYEQKYNEDHRDDVLCMAMSLDGKIAASGAMGKKPRIVVYSTEGAMQTIQVMSGFHKRAVSSLAFCGDLLASVGEDESHSVAVYNWKTGTLVASAKGEKNKVFGICFNEDGTRLAQCGVNHIRFWELKGRNLAPKKGLMKGHGKIQPFLSVCHLGVKDKTNDYFVFGGTMGVLYVFKGRECVGTMTDSTAAVKQHTSKKGKVTILRHANDGAINALSFHQIYENRIITKDVLNGQDYKNVIVSGGRSGWVKMWDADLILNPPHLIHGISKENREKYRDADTNNCCEDHECLKGKGSDHYSGCYKECSVLEESAGRKGAHPKCAKGCFCNLHCKPLAKFHVSGAGQTALGNPEHVWQVRSVSCFSKAKEEGGGGGQDGRMVVATRGGQMWEYNLWDRKDEVGTPLGDPGPNHSFVTAEIIQHCRGRKSDEWKTIPLVQGHWKDEVWGLAMSPVDSNIYATVGDDCTLRVWDIKAQHILGQTTLEGMARSVAFSPDTSLIAVGLGGSVGRGKGKMDGWVYIYDGKTEKSGFDVLEKAQTMHHAKGWISDLKFSPDGRTLACGSHDNHIYLYDIYPPANSPLPEEASGLSESKSNSGMDGGGTVQGPSRGPQRAKVRMVGSAKEAFKGRSIVLRGICKGHSSYITHLDFSADSKWLQTTCGAYELLFWDVRGPKNGAYTKKKPQKVRQQTNATAMRDVDWATWTVTLGWPVQGIWPKCADGTDINAVDLNGV